VAFDAIGGKAIDDLVERDRSQTALTRAFEQIEKSEAQLRHIVDAIPQMIGVLNPDGTFLYMNQTMLDYTGLTIERVQITMGGAQHSHVDGNWPATADTFDFTFLQHSQQCDLDLRGQVADFVQKNRPPIRRFKTPQAPR